MTSTRVQGRFELVYLVFNTISNVTTQDGQVAVFRNAAAHLVPGGRFVVELNVPQLQRVPPGERFHVFSRTEEHVGIDEYDVATQRMWSHHHTFHEGGGSPDVGAVPLRLAGRARPDGPPRRHGAGAAGGPTGTARRTPTTAPRTSPSGACPHSPR